MNKLSFGKSRVVTLREIMGFSQKDFAEKIGITQGALSQIESGKSHASFDTIKKISDEFNINCNWLIKGIGQVSLEKSEELHVPEVRISTTLTQLPSMREKALIPLVREEAHAGYVTGFEDGEYIKTLDVYQIPGFEKGNYRLFEVAGDSMLPTIHPREIVVCEFVKTWTDIENGTLCVLISKEGIVAKRAYYYEDNRSAIILKSDNPKFKTYSMPVEEVLEVWTIKAKITSLFTDAEALDAKRIERLEADISLLKEQFQELKKKK